MVDLQKIGRLALRHEGTWWNAYYAMPDTMQGAILVAKIRFTAVAGKPERKTAFIALAREAIADIIEEKTGFRPSWPDGPQAAPEHERAGHA